MFLSSVGIVKFAYQQIMDEVNEKGSKHNNYQVEISRMMLIHRLPYVSLTKSSYSTILLQ